MVPSTTSLGSRRTAPDRRLASRARRYPRWSRRQRLTESRLEGRGQREQRPGGPRQGRGGHERDSASENGPQAVDGHVHHRLRGPLEPRRKRRVEQLVPGARQESRRAAAPPRARVAVRKPGSTRPRREKRKTPPGWSATVPPRPSRASAGAERTVWAEGDERGGGGVGREEPEERLPTPSSGPRPRFQGVVERASPAIRPTRTPGAGGRACGGGPPSPWRAGWVAGGVGSPPATHRSHLEATMQRVETAARARSKPAAETYRATSRVATPDHAAEGRPPGDPRDRPLRGVGIEALVHHRPEGGEKDRSEERGLQVEAPGDQAGPGIAEDPPGQGEGGKNGKAEVEVFRGRPAAGQPRERIADKAESAAEVIIIAGKEETRKADRKRVSRLARLWPPPAARPGCRPAGRRR